MAEMRRVHDIPAACKGCGKTRTYGLRVKLCDRHFGIVLDVMESRAKAPRWMKPYFRQVREARNHQVVVEVMES